MKGPSSREASGHELFSTFDVHVVYTPWPVNPLDDFLSGWAYPANVRVGDVSIHGTAQTNDNLQDMMAAGKEELIARPLVFWAVVAPVGTRSRSKTAPQAIVAPACDTTPRALSLVGGGGERKEKEKSFGSWSKLPK